MDSNLEEDVGHHTDAAKLYVVCPFFIIFFCFVIMVLFFILFVRFFLFFFMYFYSKTALKGPVHTGMLRLRCDIFPGKKKRHGFSERFYPHGNAETYCRKYARPVCGAVTLPPKYKKSTKEDWEQHFKQFAQEERQGCLIHVQHWIIVAVRQRGTLCQITVNYWLGVILV